MTQEMEQLIDKYWDEDEHDKIVQLIMAVPEEERDIDMLGQLVVAYNNLGRYEDAVALSMELKEESKEIIAWYYRIGYAMVNMGEYKKAAEYLDMGMELVNKQNNTRLLPELKGLYSECRPYLEAGEVKLRKEEPLERDKKSYHKDLPQSWIEIIEKDAVLKELWVDHNSEYEAVPEFLFGLIGDELKRLEPIFALYGEPGIDMYEKILEIKALSDSCSDEAALSKYTGYFYVREKGNEEIAQKLVKEYIQAMNDLYINEFEEDAILDEDAEITFVPAEERSKVIKELYEAWEEGEDTPENEFNEVICDWYIFELEYKDGCEELKNLLWEAVYNLEEDYKMSYYLMWSLADRPDTENPYLPFYKLWCMGYTARFAAKDQVLVC